MYVRLPHEPAMESLNRFLALVVATAVVAAGSLRLDAQTPARSSTVRRLVLPVTGTMLLVHSAGAPESLVPSVRRLLQSLDQTLPVNDVQTLNDTFAPMLYFYRLFGLLVGAGGLLALLLAVIGIYGVVAYAVSQRTREIGIRMALGADKPQILRLVMWQGMLLVVCGLSVGLLLALALTRVLTSAIFDIEPTDPWMLVGASVLFAAIGLVACWMPTRRAAEVDALEALRAE